MRAGLLAVYITLLVIVASPAAAFNFARSEPEPAPEITFLDAEGNQLSLEAFEGQVVVLNLWATWCAPCREEMPSLDRLQAEHGGEDLQVVALSLDRGDSLDKVKEFYGEVGIEHLAIYRDPEGAAGRVFKAPGLPTTIVIDAAGREVGRALGAAEWDSPEAIALLEEIVGG